MEGSAPPHPAGGSGPGGVRRWLVRGGQLLATVLVTWFLLARVGISLEDLRAAGPGVWRPRGGMLLLASGVLLGAYVAAAGLWGLMVRELGGPGLSFLASARIFLTANLGRYVPGKVWQVAGLAYLARKEGVPGATAVAAAVLGQGLALVAATLVGLGAFLQADSGLTAAGLLALGAAGLAVGLVSLPPLFHPLLRAWFRLVGGESPPDPMPGPTFALRWVGVYVASWLFQGTAFWLLSLSLEPTASFARTAPAYVAAYVLGYVAVFAPAGIGIREGFLILLLEPTLGATAAAVAVLARLWTTVLEVAAAAALGGLHLMRGKGTGHGGSS